MSMNPTIDMNHNKSKADWFHTYQLQFMSSSIKNKYHIINHPTRSSSTTPQPCKFWETTERVSNVISRYKNDYITWDAQMSGNNSLK